MTTAEAWWKKRRPEIVEDFDREVYGRVPKDAPKVTWEVVTRAREEKIGDIPALTRSVVGHADHSAFPPPVPVLRSSDPVRGLLPALPAG